MPTTWFETKVLRVIVMLLLFCSTQSLIAQTNPLPDEVVITYITKNRPLESVLNELSDKSGVSITFNPKRIPGNRKVTINAVQQPLGIVLKAILRDKRCRYDIIGNQIVVTRVSKRTQYRDLTISGYVSDKKTGEMLIGANVYLLDKTKGTQTNEYGFYSFTLTRGTKRMYYSYLGYTQEVKETFLQRDTTINIELVPDAQLNEIIILDDVENQEEPQTYSQSKLNLDRITKATSLLGEGDVIRLVGQMPGVDSGADGLGGLNVRGGSADQNLVLLDGVPIYNVNHALGLFSVFNSDVIKNATLIKGNIPARYGGRLSSVLDVRTKDGNRNAFGGTVSLSAIAGKASFEGPIGSNGSSFMVSARRTFLDQYIKGITSFFNEQEGNEGFTNYYFTDFNGKVGVKLNKKNTLYLSAFWGNDSFVNDKKSVSIDGDITNTIDKFTDWDWGNRVLSAKLTSQYSNKTFARLTAYYTAYQFDSFEYDDFFSTDTQGGFLRSYKAGYYKSAINDLSLKYDLDYIINPSHLLRTGVGAIQHNFSPGLVSVSTTDEVFLPGEEPTPGIVESLVEEPKLDGLEYYGFLEDEISLGGGTILNVGVHANVINTGEQTYYSFQPRVALLAKSTNIFFKGGLSRMNQYLHLLSSNGLGLPTDVWLPSTDELAPEKSWIATAGVGYFDSKGYRAGIEGYYKIFDAITTFDEGGVENIGVNTQWQERIPVGSGTAYGVEAYFNKIIGRTVWNSNYTLAFAFRDFEDLTVGDEPFPFRYNRRHNLKLGALHKITDNTEFNLNWNLSSGNPVTSPSGAVISDQNGSIQVLYLEKNGGVLPTYHRVDIGFNFYNKHKWGRTKLSIGVYNVFNKRNAFYTDIENSADNPNRYQVLEVSILPVLPTIGYSVSF